MIQMAYDRISKLVEKERIFIITNENYFDLVKTQPSGIDEKNIIVEPFARNTAPCILLSSLYIKQLYGDVNIIVLPYE